MTDGTIPGTGASIRTRVMTRVRARVRARVRIRVLELGPGSSNKRIR